MTRAADTLAIAQQSMQLLAFGEMLLRSGLLPNSIRKPETAVALMVKGMELGLPPMAAINGISVIQGKPTVSPQLMLSLINRSGQLEDITIEASTTSATVTMKRRGRSPHTATFGPAEARAMGLDGKDNYRKQPATMYQWRAVAACARVVFPDVIDGLYTPEELGADVTEDGEVVTTQAEVLQEPKADDKADLRHWAARIEKRAAKIAEKYPEARGAVDELRATYAWQERADEAAVTYKALGELGKRLFAAEQAKDEPAQENLEETA